MVKKLTSLALVALLLSACAPASPAREDLQPETSSSASPTTPETATENTTESASGYITYEDFLASPEKYSDSNVVLFYNAYWCSTCKAARDGFESGKSSIPADLTIVLVDFDENTEMRKKHDVIVQHTFIQIDSAGAEVQRWYGSTSVAEIVEKIS